MIQHLWSKCKVFGSYLTRTDVYCTLIIILVAGGSFGFGALYAEEHHRPAVTIQDISGSLISTSTLQEGISVSPKAGGVKSQAINGSIVASKKGTKYHLLSCPGASQIKEENKIYFNSVEDAEKAGYTRASNCK